MTPYYIDLAGRRLWLEMLVCTSGIAFGVAVGVVTSVEIVTSLVPGFSFVMAGVIYQGRTRRATVPALPKWLEALSEVFFGPDRASEFFGDLPIRIERWDARYGESLSFWVARGSFAEYFVREFCRKTGFIVEAMFRSINWFLDELKETCERIVKVKEVLLVFVIAGTMFALRLQALELLRHLLRKLIEWT